MAQNLNTLKVSAPGRICLFGEHLDYLHLPVIPCAISLRISVSGKRRDDSIIYLNLPDIGDKKSFPVKKELSYIEERDYFRSAINILQRDGFTFKNGFDCEVRGNIPINSGTSSSSALVVAWIGFLAQMSDQSIELPPEKIAEYAHKAEVVEFSEPGGMMDHYSSAIGGVIFLDFLPKTVVEAIHADLKTFVLGDSGEPKDTKSILARVKNQIIGITELMTLKFSDFSLRELAVEDILKYDSELTDEQRELLVGTIRNYHITQEAKRVLLSHPLDHKKMGELLNEHQQILRDVLKISTPKIDRMIDAALGGGAYGGKINGSGGGGCMFVYAPEHPQKIAEAIEKEGGKAYIISVDRGVMCDN